MTQPLSFGISTLQHVPWSKLVGYWRHAEALGLDSAWMPDHLVHPRESHRPWLEAWTLLAALAARTERIRIGTMVTNVLFRNPVLLLKQAVTVDHVSSGRLELALGSGNAAASCAATGLDAGDAVDRERRFAEAIELMARLLRGEQVTYRGDYYQTTDVLLQPMPAQQPRPRLTLAGRRPATLRLAAQYADAWNMFVWPFGLPAEVAHEQARTANEQLTEYAAAVGRDPGQIGRSLVAGVAQETLWSSVAAFHDFIGRYREIGFTEFIFLYPPEEFAPPGAVQPGIFEQVAREVLPSMKTRSLSTGLLEEQHYRN